jgi:hypothetical protein
VISATCPCNFILDPSFRDAASHPRHGVGIDLLVSRLDAVAGAGAGRRGLADPAV